MKKIGSSPISVALHGMDPRSCKMMAMYLKVTCRGVAVVVDEADAEVDIIDADFATAGDILQSRRQKTPLRPIILLSLQTLQIENTFFVKKPVNAEQLMTTLLKAWPRLESGKQTPVKSEFTQAALLQSAVSTSKVSVNQPPPPTKSSRNEVRSQIATHKHESPATMFLGTIAGIDFRNPAQWPEASYDPKKFFLGYVQSAFKIANQKTRAVQLNSTWRPLLIFPGSQEIWLDADDKQLRAFAGIEQSRTSSNAINLAPVNIASTAPNNFQDMEAFLWKLTIWTSKGRFPLGLDLQRPVFLKRWPNFTRLMMTPDAMRISALLMQGARTPLDIVNTLKINPQYVFVFISACQSTGLLGVSRRHVDDIIASAPPEANKKQGLLSKILNKLRGE